MLNNRRRIEFAFLVLLHCITVVVFVLLAGGGSAP